MLLLQKIPFWGYDISETKLAKIREKVKNLPNTSVLIKPYKIFQTPLKGEKLKFHANTQQSKFM